MSANARRSIAEKIDQGEFYDAQQMVKTVHRRLRAKGQHDEGVLLCVESARRFCDVGEHDLAADLGRDLVAALEAAEAPPSEDNLGHVEAIFGGIPPSQAQVSKYAFLHKALRWSAGESHSGHPRLHRLIARAHRAEKDYGRSQAHLVYCGDGPELAAMVQEWRRQGYPGEELLFSLRTLLILLALNDVSTARSFWEAVGDATPPPGEEATTTSWVPEPPAQCGTFLLDAVEAKSLEFFRQVRGKYALVVRRDASFDRFLDEIEERVFGAGPQRSGLGALFEALVGGVGGGVSSGGT